MRRSTTLTLLALAFTAACSDNQPTSPPQALQLMPRFTEHDPAEGSGACMLDDAKTWHQFMSGWSANSDATKTNNCTTNDVRLAQSRATAYYNPNHQLAVDGWVPLEPGDNIQCTNSTVRVRMSANLVQGSQSTRHDFGIWLRTNLGSQTHPLSAGARTGECNHYNLPIDPPNTVDADGDLCADMTQQAQALVDFGELEIPCETDPGTSELRVHSCIAWKVPGDEGDFPKGHCPAYNTTGTKQNPIHTVIEGGDGFRAGSLPGNTSKCNCEPTGLQVFVAPSSIVIEKVTVGGAGGPFDFTTTGGLSPSSFDLTTTGAGAANKVAQTYSGLSAGDYSVTESAPPAGWVLSNVSCTAGGVVDQNNAAKVNITLTPGATVTCTFTNTKQAQLRVAKVTVPADDPTEFTFTPTNWNSGSTFTRKHGDAAFASGLLAPGNTNYDVVETVPTDWELTSVGCVLTGSSTVKSSSSLTDGVRVQLAAGEDVTCTFTNTYIPPDLSIVKTRAAATVNPGQKAEYTITVSNAANAGTANNVVLTDPLPVPSGSGLTWSVKSVTNDPTPTCNINAGTQILTCTVAALAGGKNFSVTVESSEIDASIVQVDPDASEPIDIDGDLVNNGGRDWQALAQINCGTGVGCQLDLSGKSDDSFGGGVKEDTENPKITTGSIPPNKSDLQRFYVATEGIGSGSLDYNALYLAWIRVQAPKGTTNMDFELNQSATLYPNNATPVRTHGDILVRFDLESGGTNPTLGFHRWLTHGPDPCEASNSKPCWGQVISLAGNPNVDADVNTVQVHDPIANENLDPYTFGEAFINLQGAGIFGSECVSFGKAFLKSRSSSSFTSDVKDFVRPLDVEISNCAPVQLSNKASVEADNHDEIESSAIQITIDVNGT